MTKRPYTFELNDHDRAVLEEMAVKSYRTLASEIRAILGERVKAWKKEQSE